MERRGDAGRRKSEVAVSDGEVPAVETFFSWNERKQGGPGRSLSGGDGAAVFYFSVDSPVAPHEDGFTVTMARRPFPRFHDPPKRYLPDQPLPAYSYVPGHHRRGVSDPSEDFAERTDPAAGGVPDAEQWGQCEAYLRGIDLLNFGYYWEAHEAWEEAWHATGRRGRLADLLKGLIKIAAAGVKARQGSAAGVRRHGARAEQCFLAIRSQLESPPSTLMGLSLSELLAIARDLQATLAPSVIHPDPELRMPYTLRPQ